MSLLPDASGESRRKNPLSLLSRWKIFDNLRRSLVPATLTLCCCSAGRSCRRPGWTLGLGTLLVPPWISSPSHALSEAGRVLISQHLAGVARSVGRHSAQAAFSLACLPYEAFFSLDAIVRTAVRMLVTHTRLLEWNPSGDADRTRRTGLAADLRTMWIGPVLATAAALHLALLRPAALAVASPILALWIASLLSSGGSAGRCLAAPRG